MFMSTATRSLFSLVRSYAILAKDCDHSSFSLRIWVLGPGSDHI